MVHDRNIFALDIPRMPSDAPVRASDALVAQSIEASLNLPRYRMAESLHASAVIRAFVAPERQDRFLALLRSERGREKLRCQLAHFGALDVRFAQRIAGSAQTPECIARLLRAEGAPETCVLLAEDTALDGRAMPLEDALREVVGRGLGAFVSCVPGRLAYFEGEDAGARYLLRRSA